MEANKVKFLTCFKSQNTKLVHKSDFNAQEVVVDNYDIVNSQKGLKVKDRIVKLPGQPYVKFSQYGGYVTVDKLAGRALYFYFVESQHSKEKMPLLLWLNGGLGCMTLAYGAMEELGPFRVNSDGKTLKNNRYSWNYAANVLFLESPAGVGFSYSNRSSDYDTSEDRKTSTNNYIFLVNWLERFPEYKKRDFYIAGESYAGHYVPQLAHTILHNNKNANKTIINLKGIMIGNAVINDETDSLGMINYLASHAIISHQASHDIKTFCNFSPDDNPIHCQTAKDEYDRDVSFIDIYNIFAPLCNNPNLTTFPKKSSNTIKPMLEEIPQNRDGIQSGDIDGRVSVTSTKYSIKKMNMSSKTAWYPWFFNGEVGGYAGVYSGGQTLATVREAGHEVPSYQPGRELSLIMHFLKGTQLPTTKTQP